MKLFNVTEATNSYYKDHGVRRETQLVW